MKKALFIGLVWPEPRSSAAGWRMIQLVSLFQREYTVHFASAATKTAYSHDLEEMGVVNHEIALNDASFDGFVQELQPDVVVFDRFMVEEQYGWRISANCPQAVRILDTEDLHFLRSARVDAYRKNQPVNIYNDTALREIAAIYRSDLSLIISEAEVQLLKTSFNLDDHLIHFLPFYEKPLTQEQILGKPSFDERKDFVFIGNFVHEPNWKTVEVLKRNIWPKLHRELPDAELHIYGSYTPQKADQLHDPKERFLIKGRADEAREMLERYRVLLAPIPVGAGIKGKFVDAMYSGTPSISSSIGAEGMRKGELWNGYVVDDDEEVVKQAKILYTNKKEWLIAQQTGFEIFNISFADTQYTQSFLRRCQELSENLANHRNKNFMGRVLQHHTMQSTKYMSLWIAEKNKKAH